MFQSSSKILLTALVCGALSACSSGGGGSGGSGGGGGGGGGDNDPRTFAELANEGLELENEISALDYTDPSSLQTTGSAQYNGVVGLLVEGGTDPASIIAGDLTMNVGFAQNSISGSVTNIVDGNNDRYQGQLTVGNGVIDRTIDPDFDYTYSADVAGDVTDPLGTEWDIQAEMLGDFFGSNYSHTGGIVSGDACILEGCVYLDGEFGAQR